MNQINLKKITERNLYLCQQILCDRKVAEEVNKEVTAKIEKRIRMCSDMRLPEIVKLSHQVVNTAIDDCFMKMIQNIKSDQNKLYQMLQKRFLNILENKMRKDLQLFHHDHDKYEILQRTLITIHQKIEDFKSNGLFIQWAQKILDNKYKEYRRELIRRKGRTKSYSHDEFEKFSAVRLDDVIQSRKESKEVNSEILVNTLDCGDSDSDGVDPFSNDPFKWGPMVLLEYQDLKKHLTRIIKKMKEPCNRVFMFLLFEGGRHNIQELFPDMNRANIDLIIFRCRKKLKQFTTQEEIYEML